MPVIGHALAGIVIAQKLDDAAHRHSPPAGPVARALWMPALVFLSYLPDIVTQVGVWFRYESAQEVGHSIPLGLIVGAIIGVAWARASGGASRSLAALCAGVVLLHDLLDLLQDSQRTPFWPLSSVKMGGNWLDFSDRLWVEAIVFGVPFILFEAWRSLRRRAQAGEPVLPRSRRLTWLGRGLVGALLAATVGVLYLRDTREREMNAARRLLRSGKAQEALAAITHAERWPSSAGAGDLNRGEAYDQLGDRARAEAAFLRAVERDPDDFWPLAVLAEHYASYGSSEERRTRTAPYVEDLKQRFPGHEALGRVLQQINRQLRLK